MAVICAGCGQEHGASSQLWVPGLAPSQAGTVAEPYPSGELSQLVAEVKNSKVGCTVAGDYPAQPDLAQWRLQGSETSRGRALDRAEPRAIPFCEMGQAPGVIRRFGGAERLQETLDELQARLYAA